MDNLAAQDDKEVRARSLPEIMANGSFGAKLGAAFAIMLGGVSQGLTGAKTNPALDAINQAVEQQAQKDKLTLAKKESLRKALLDQAMLKIHAMAQQTNDEFKKGELANAAAKIAIESDNANKAQRKLIEQEKLRAQANATMGSVVSPIPTATPEIAAQNKHEKLTLKSMMKFVNN